MKWQESAVGFATQQNGFLYFFGKRNANLAGVTAEYPRLQWARVKQTHSDRVLESPAPTEGATREGDAHWTSTAGLGLLIATADCTPVLVSDARSGRCASVHAGWRGVASRITAKTIEGLVAEGSRAEDLFAVLGPHIGFSSFEVQADVRDQLIASVRDLSPTAVRPIADQKFLVDLTALVKVQLRESGLRTENIACLELDTKTDLRFHSHRRDRELAGRQLSFIARLDERAFEGSA